MTPENYQKFTDIMKQRLEADNRVLGLIAVGSMAGRDYSLPHLQQFQQLLQSKQQ